MKKWLFITANYKVYNLPYMTKVLENYKTVTELFNIEIHCIIMTTEIVPVPPQTDKFSIEQVIYPESLGFELLWKSRIHLKENYGKFDVYIFTDNDLLIEPQDLIDYLDHDNTLPDDVILGLTRYEIGQDEQKYAVDLPPKLAEPFVASTEINGEKYVVDSANFQGGYILTQRRMKRFYESESFSEQPGIFRNLGIAELALSDPLVRSNMIRILSVSKFDYFIAHHTTNRWIEANEIITTYGLHSHISITKGFSHLWHYQEKMYTVEQLALIAKEI